MAISESLGQQQEVQLPQGTINYRERGTGEPIVFVHGALVNARPVAQGRARAREGLPLHRPGPAARLAHAGRCRADADLSPPGAAKLIADFIAALDLDNVTLVGNDTGGALCQLVVTRHPERIGRLVLTNCDAYDKFPPSFFKFLFLRRAHPRLRDGAVPADADHRAAQQRRSRYGWLVEARHPRGDHRRLGAARPRRTRGVRRDTTKLLKGVAPALHAGGRAATSRSSTSRC